MLNKVVLQRNMIRSLDILFLRDDTLTFNVTPHSKHGTQFSYFCANREVDKTEVDTDLNSLQWLLQFNCMW